MAVKLSEPKTQGGENAFVRFESPLAPDSHSVANRR
jgi:hypothetical protein